MNLITASSLTKSFRRRHVIKGIDLTIGQGKVIAMIGPNGAGKSTIISMLAGIIKPDGGAVTHWREDYRAHMGVQLQATPFFEGYTAEENLALFAAMYRVRLNKLQLREKLAECGLADTGKTPAARLSLGQQKRLALAVTTLHRPQLIVLDEPAAGLDPRASHEIRQVIRSMAANGSRTVLFSSHDMEEVERTADQVIFIRGGRVAADGEPAALKQEHGVEHLEELYLKLTEA